MSTHTVDIPGILNFVVLLIDPAFASAIESILKQHSWAVPRLFRDSSFSAEKYCDDTAPANSAGNPTGDKWLYSKQESFDKGPAQSLTDLDGFRTSVSAEQPILRKYSVSVSEFVKCL